MQSIAIRIVFTVLLLIPNVFAFDIPYGDLQLLPGYEFRRERSLDTINGSIIRTDGFVIEFEKGINEGLAADPRNRNRYIWFKEQKINGNKVFIAFTKQGVGTKWEPRVRRHGVTVIGIMIISYPGPFGNDDAANFYAEVSNEVDVLDMTLMALTFNPLK
jgi:hypothetical protein